MRSVLGRIRVASTSPVLDALLSTPEACQVVANLAHGDARRSVSFDECWLEDKQFELSRGGHAETVYTFSATRVREEDTTA